MLLDKKWPSFFLSRKDVNLSLKKEVKMARDKYSIKRKEGKEKFLKEAVALFGDDPEP